MSADRSTRVRRNRCFRWTALWPPPLPSSSTSCTSIAAEFRIVAAVAASSVNTTGAEMSGHQEARSAYRRCSAALPVIAVIFPHLLPAAPPAFPALGPGRGRTAARAAGIESCPATRGEQAWDRRPAATWIRARIRSPGRRGPCGARWRRPRWGTTCSATTRPSTGCRTWRRGCQAALYLPTGTMCNQIAMHVFARSGHLVVCEEDAHTGGMEVSSSAVLSGIAFHRVPAPSRGLLAAPQVAAALTPGPYCMAVVDLVTIENTHQVGGGSVMGVHDVAAIAKVCADHGLPLYLDGARIFNACTVAGVAVADYATHADAMMFCLSKGLGAPIGSMLVGEAEFIREARGVKILFGGGWRQAGIMAAAGLIALAEGPGRLADDHANARRLAEGVARIVPGCLDPAGVETNIVFADVASLGHPLTEWAAALAAEGVLVSTVTGRLRMVTHVDVARRDVDTALAAWRRVAAELGA